MNLKTLSDMQIESGLKQSFKKEKEGFLETIHFLLEVDRRKLHRDTGNLAYYIMQKFEVSEPAARQRIKAMLMAKEIPQTIQMLETNKLNMTQIADLKRACAQKEAKLDEKVPTNVKLELMEKIAGKTCQESQEILAKELNLPLAPPEGKKGQKDGTVSATFTIDKELQDLLQQCQDLAAHAMKQNHQSQSLANLMKHVCKQYLKSRKPKTQKKSEASTITPKRRQEVIERDKHCQYKMSNGQKCESKFMLEADHIVPVWSGGTDELENLQCLCSYHNKLKYQQNCGKFRKAPPAAVEPETNPEMQT